MNEHRAPYMQPSTTGTREIRRAADPGVTQVREDPRVLRQTQVATCLLRGFIETTRACQVVGQVDSRQVERRRVTTDE